MIIKKTLATNNTGIPHKTINTKTTSQLNHPKTKEE